MDLHNLEGPSLDKDQFDEYQEFVKNEQPYDRRASQDFFAAESERMERELEELQKKRNAKHKRQKKFSCFNAQTSKTIE